MDKLVTSGLVERSKNSNFILESKMTELNQNKSSKQPVQSDAVRKRFDLGNKCIAHLTRLFKVGKLCVFLQFSAHVILGHNECL